MPVSSTIVKFRGEGVDIVGDEWLPADTPRGTVILSHGGGQTRHSWRRTGEWLADQGWRAIALDTRGHGDSDWSPDNVYSMDRFVSDLVAVIDQVGEAPVVIGASLGGTTGAIVAGERPGSIRGLVLVDIAPRVEKNGADRIRAFMASAPDGFADLEEAAAAIHAYNPRRPAPPNPEGLRKNLRQHADGRWYWHWDPGMLDLPEEPRGGSGEARVYRAARALTIPVLLVRGSDSDILTPEGVEEFRALVPHAEFVEVSAGHMVAGDDNDVFTRNVTDFLDRV
jgi:pimeloyl-ACP methyl ester carboxylesterase